MIYRIVLVAFTFILGITALNGQSENLHNVRPVRFNEWPFLVQLNLTTSVKITKRSGARFRSRNFVLCTGALFTSQHVLTAAHCLTDDNGDVNIAWGESEKEVLFCHSREDPNCNENFADVKGFTIHPSYDPHTLENDIAWLTLKRPVAIEPLAVLNRDEAKHLECGDAAALFGNVKGEILQANVLIEFHCNQQRGYSTVGAKQFCTVAAGVQSGPGSSGGPFVAFTPWGPRLAGVLSAGFSQNSRYPNVLENVSLHYKFIVEHVPEARNRKMVSVRRPRNVQRLREFRDCDICPQMVAIPPGNFMMGSRGVIEGNFDDELPMHRVGIDYFFAVGKYEVTVEEYSVFVEKSGYDGGRSCWISLMEERDGLTWRNPGYRQSGGNPVACVSWRDANAYIRWLSRRTGKKYRLLSEAEWEYAARAGSDTRYHFGNAISSEQASYLSGETVAVGRYEPNAFGLHDMHGNVWEWIADCWHGNYRGAPQNGEAWTAGDCKQRMLRGGAWNFPPFSLRSAARAGNQPDLRSNSYGFRVARMLGNEAPGKFFSGGMGIEEGFGGR